MSWTTSSSYSHTPTPTSCGTCHGATGTFRNDIPSGIVNKMAHTYAGIGDCVNCHTSVPANIGVTWAGGKYNHSPAPSTCNECHSPQRPVGAVGSPVAFDHSGNGGTGDCVNCHSGVGTTWAGGKFVHNASMNCVSCHLSELPGTNLWYPTQPTSYRSPGAFNHPSNYGTDCKSCHTTVAANIGVSWKKGYFEHAGNGLNSNSSCTPCHKYHGDGTACFSCHRHSLGTFPTANPSGNYGGVMAP